MDRIEFGARLREVRIKARHSKEEAIKMLTDLLRDLYDELEELKRGVSA
ncbi:MAG: hypothetical protein H0Z18_08165 [Thermococcus sp.]|nr:hypothetical protein [Thermococcus sp.]MBO8175218.1 hypothetical protein [Thermococcus sp.]